MNVKNRYTFFKIVIAVMLGILVVKLSFLTLIEGSEYRDISDNSKIRTIYTTAPRGEIRDRYGRLIAGNKPSFAVQLYKDVLNEKKPEEKNEILLDLIGLLDEDGVIYSDEFPVDFNYFIFTDPESFRTSGDDPTEFVIKFISDKNLFDKIIDLGKVINIQEKKYKFRIINRIMYALKVKYIDLPINYKITQNKIEFYADKEFDNWKNKNSIDKKLNPKEVIYNIMKDDDGIMKKVLDHPIARELIYKRLCNYDIQKFIKTKDIVNTYLEKYYLQKQNLMREYPYVTMATSAKQDFINIVKNTSLKDILENIYKNNDGEIIAPGRILYDMIKNTGKEPFVEPVVNLERMDIVYKYKGKEDVKDINPLDIFIKEAEDLGIVGDFIIDDRIKGYAQKSLIDKQIVTKISISNDFEYTDLMNYRSWLKLYYKEKEIGNQSIEETFEKARNRYKIDDKLDKYEAKSLLSIYEVLLKQGYLAYQPINIAYGIKNETVAKIEQRTYYIDGVNISIEPVRYYPMGTTMCHVIGTLGKISQDFEIKKYIDEMGYAQNAMIGKTGIEESYEKELAGKSGKNTVEIDHIGNKTNILKEEKAVQGNTVYTTIDSKLQKICEENLEKAIKAIRNAGTFRSKWGDYKMQYSKKNNHIYSNATAGAIVVTNPQTGEILAMASYPGYNLNLFSTGISATDWENLMPKDEKNPLAARPLYNISTQTAIQPGSIFKMVTGLAALEKGLNPETRIRDMGYVELGDKKFRCLLWTDYGRTHGNINISEAIKVSCNYFFYSLALGENQRLNKKIEIKLNIEDIIDMAARLGLNEKSGIEINTPKEFSGGVPDPQKKLLNMKYYLKKYLKDNLQKYAKNNVQMDESKIRDSMDKILTWLERGSDMTRGEVISKLEDMGFDTERKLNGKREGIADIIKYSYLNQAKWNTADTLYVTIGQGESQYTPIQMANYIATIANGGYLNKMTLIDSIRKYENNTLVYSFKRSFKDIGLKDKKHLLPLKKGMRMVAESGTAKDIFAKFPIKVAAKTGTAEKNGKNPYTKMPYDPFAWFVSFAPYDEPKIAISAVIFQGGTGINAAPMVREVIAEYLGLNDSEIKEELPFKNVFMDWSKDDKK